MADRSLGEQLTKYLADAHSIEEQALQQLRKAPEIAGDRELTELFSRHLDETEEHERLMRKRLGAYGQDPSTFKDAIMRAGGVAFVLFAQSQPDTPGKLTAHAYSYEHLELATYEMLMRFAERAGDEETVEAAREIRDNERSMAQRLSTMFDAATGASLAAVARDDLADLLVSYLSDAHAIEAQAEQMLQSAAKGGGDAELERLYAEHLEETREHGSAVRQRLEEREASPSKIKDAAMRLGALNWGTFFKAQPDTPVKLAAFAYAFEHLEIAGYELLQRVAQRAGDGATVDATKRILEQERSMAQRLLGSFDRAVEETLRTLQIA